MDIKKGGYVFYIIGIILLLSPHILRQNFSGSLIGDEAYYHLRIIESIKENSTDNTYDGLFIGGRQLSIQFIDRIASYVSSRGSFIRYFPLCLGIISVFLIYAILSKIVEDENMRFYQGIIIAMSPIFIYIFTLFDNSSLVVPVILFSIFLMLKNRYILSGIGFILCLLLSFDCFPLILIILLLIYEKDIGNKSISIMGMIILTLFFVFSQGIGAEGQISVMHFMPDFGAEIGFSVFGILLGLLGLILSWADKKKYSTLYVAIACIFLLSFSIPVFALFFQGLLAYFGALATKFLVDRKWQMNVLRDYTLLLMMCGLAFSSWTYVIGLSEYHPYDEEMETMTWIKENTPENSIILSHYQDGILIHSIAKRPVLVDQIYYDTSETKARIEYVDEIFRSRRLVDTCHLLQEYNVTHIYITPDMKSGLVWEREEEGLLFLLKNSENFKRVYDNQGIELWKVESLESK